MTIFSLHSEQSVWCLPENYATPAISHLFPSALALLTPLQHRHRIYTVLEMGPEQVVCFDKARFLSISGGWFMLYTVRRVCFISAQVMTVPSAKYFVTKWKIMIYFVTVGLYFFCLSISMPLLSLQRYSDLVLCLMWCPVWTGVCSWKEVHWSQPKQGCWYYAIGLCCIYVLSQGFSCQYLRTVLRWRDAICNSQKNN